ncbi:MAG: serine/threonine protein kinase [Gammaproteobacteria bacterium]
MEPTNNAALAYQELQPDDIISAVEALGYPCDGRFLALNSYENRVYQVGVEDQPALVVKFYRPGRWTDAGIQEEHDFTIDLAEQDIPVVIPIEHNGVTLHHHEAFRYAVYQSYGGHAPELDDYELLAQLGRLVGRIHLLGETARFEHRPELNLQSFGIESHDYLLDNDFIPADLEPAYTSICADLFTAIPACYERAGATRNIRLHGDFHPGNVLNRNHVLHIVDFDDARTGPPVQDLWMFLSGDRDEQEPQLAELLDGYTEFRSFDTRELNLIEALRTLRLMHYAAWLARRWEDPAFKHAFPWFNSQRYWDDHILALREQSALMQEEPVAWLEN